MQAQPTPEAHGSDADGAAHRRASELREVFVLHRARLVLEVANLVVFAHAESQELVEATAKWKAKRRFVHAYVPDVVFCHAVGILDEACSHQRLSRLTTDLAEQYPEAVTACPYALLHAVTVAATVLALKTDSSEDSHLSHLLAFCCDLHACAPRRPYPAPLSYSQLAHRRAVAALTRAEVMVLTMLNFQTRVGGWFDTDALLTEALTQTAAEGEAAHGASSAHLASARTLASARYLAAHAVAHGLAAWFSGAEIAQAIAATLAAPGATHAPESLAAKVRALSIRQVTGASPHAHRFVHASASAAHVYPQTRSDPSGVASLLLASDFSDACNATAALADVVVSYMERPLSKGQYIYGGDRVFIVMSRTEPPVLPRTSEQLAAAI